MAGIYLHIPFCKQACHYCDFHFSTSLKYKQDFITALLKEIALQRDYLKTDETIDSVYFGGGTPSILSYKELMLIVEQLQKHFTINNKAEITLEANPDDLTEDYLNNLRNTTINRLSVGIQSFFNEDLQWMNRSHSAEQAISSIKMAQDKGISNITIDLIYGIPMLSDERWRKNLELAFDSGVKHISAYCLTIEPQTTFGKWLKTGKIKNPDEEKNAHQFEIMLEEMKQNDFIQYEISNFCKEDNYSRHNSSYWQGKPYLGLGPSAHSFDGKSRRWNVSNNQLYIKSLNDKALNFEEEILTQTQKYNEYVLTSLRTIWGIDIDYLKKEFGVENLEYFMKEAMHYFNAGLMLKIDNKIILSDTGKLLADKIASDLFL